MTLLEFFLAGTMSAATVFLLAALGELVAEKSGMLNLGVEGMIVIIFAGSRDQFLEGVFAVLGNCELFKEANGGGLCLVDGQGGEKKKEGRWIQWNFHNGDSRFSRIFSKGSY